LNQSEAEKYCDDDECTDARGVTAGNDAHAAGNIATIGMVVGAVGIAGGLTLWLTAPSPDGSPAVGFSLTSVHLRGSW
jgi:hypothetical protein